MQYIFPSRPWPAQGNLHVLRATKAPNWRKSSRAPKQCNLLQEQYWKASTVLEVGPGSVREHKKAGSDHCFSIVGCWRVVVFRMFDSNAMGAISRIRHDWVRVQSFSYSPCKFVPSTSQWSGMILSHISSPVIGDIAKQSTISMNSERAFFTALKIWCRHRFFKCSNTS